MNAPPALARACTDGHGHSRHSLNGKGNQIEVAKADQVGPSPWLRALQAALAVLAFAAGLARAETFDLVTFDAPAGQRQAGLQAMGFSEATPTTFVTYAVYKGAASSGDPARDFGDEWKLLLGQYRLTSELKSQTTDWPGGWKLTIGTAKVWGDQQRNFTALLNVFTGHGVKVSVLVNYNDDLYQPKIDKFFASVRLAPPAGVAASAPAPPVPRGSAGAPGAGVTPTLTSQEWFYVAANYPNSWARATWSYRFQPDGTYTFVHEFSSLHSPDEFTSVEESGTYRQSADQLTVVPKTAQRSVRDKQGRLRGQPESLASEPATYRTAFQYLEGMQAWYLVLTPASGRETQRDGGSFTYGAGYRYGPRPHCARVPKPADCRG